MKDKVLKIVFAVLLSISLGLNGFTLARLNSFKTEQETRNQVYEQSFDLQLGFNEKVVEALELIGKLFQY